MAHGRQHGGCPVLASACDVEPIEPGGDIGMVDLVDRKLAERRQDESVQTTAVTFDRVRLPPAGAITHEGCGEIPKRNLDRTWLSAKRHQFGRRPRLVQAHRFGLRQRLLDQAAPDMPPVDPGRRRPGAQPEAEPPPDMVPEHPLADGWRRWNAVLQGLIERPSIIRHRFVPRVPEPDTGHLGDHSSNDRIGEKRGEKLGQLRPHGPLEKLAVPGRIHESRGS